MELFFTKIFGNLNFAKIFLFPGNLILQNSLEIKILQILKFQDLKSMLNFARIFQGPLNLSYSNSPRQTDLQPSPAPFQNFMLTKNDKGSFRLCLLFSMMLQHLLQHSPRIAWSVRRKIFCDCIKKLFLLIFI